MKDVVLESVGGGVHGTIARPTGRMHTQPRRRTRPIVCVSRVKKLAEISRLKVEIIGSEIPRWTANDRFHTSASYGLIVLYACLASMTT